MRPGQQNSSSDGKVSYDTVSIREVAGKIMASAWIALDNHSSTWNAIQAYLDGDGSKSNSLPGENGWFTVMGNSGIAKMPDVYYFVRSVLEPHEKRLRDSFNLQLAFAQALFDLADQIDQAEQMINDGFKQPGPPSPPHPGKNP